MKIKIQPDIERAKSIMNLLKEREKIIETLINTDFPATILENYYEIIKELITSIMYIDGFKTTGEGAHIEAIDHLKNYSEFSEYELYIINELRKNRHGSQYYGKIPNPEFIEENKSDFKKIIEKLKKIANSKVQNNI